MLWGDNQVQKEYFKEKVLKLNSDRDYEEFANEMLSEPIPWFFQNKFKNQSEEKYSKFRFYMSQKFSIPPTAVMLGGSSWFGFSLSPTKKFRDFNENSDVDIVIVSKNLFEGFWDAYLKEVVYKRLYGRPYEIIAKNTFKRFVHYEDGVDFPSSAAFYTNFEKQVSGYAKDLQLGFDFPEHIGYRIYRSWEDYNLSVIHTLKDIKENRDGCNR